MDYVVPVPSPPARESDGRVRPVARWARIRAAQEDMSVSRLLRLMLEGQMEQESAYQSAMERYLQRPGVILKGTGVILKGTGVILKGKGDTYPKQDELHER